MQTLREATLLRIFVGERERCGAHPLHEAIVLKAREAGMAGATVLRRSFGYGRSQHVHTTKVLRLSFDLPLIIEIVDSEKKIEEFLPVLEGMTNCGIATIEKVQTYQYENLGASALGATSSGA